ncbi:MAG: DUF3520 domain-containing protein, partial [Cyclobacteriaceae bacterium]|nr:DUF3520 domain-containing protein [Cyclobacteriaceae bacterium]
SYIDNLLEAKKVLVNEFGGTLYTIAKDVKIQLEFNPENVIEYRLIGYENRKLSSKDFHDDNKDAGEIGAGQSVTALYEIIPNKGEDPLRPIKELRYQSVYSQYNELNDELGIIKIRYKRPDERESKLIEAIVSSEVSKTPTNDFHFSAAVAEFGMLLRDSEYKGEASYDHIIAAAGSSKGKDMEGYRSEFIRLVLLARELQKEPRIEVYE